MPVLGVDVGVGVGGQKMLTERLLFVLDWGTSNNISKFIKRYPQALARHPALANYYLGRVKSAIFCQPTSTPTSIHTKK